MQIKDHINHICYPSRDYFGERFCAYTRGIIKNTSGKTFRCYYVVWNYQLTDMFWGEQMADWFSCEEIIVGQSLLENLT